MLLGFGKLSSRDLDGYKAQVGPRAADASWQTATLFTVYWWLYLLPFDHVAVTDTGQFLLAQAAILSPWGTYRASRHGIKKHTAKINLAQDRIEAEHNVNLEETKT